MKTVLFAHLSGQPHLHLGNVALVIAALAIAAAAYFLTRRVER